MLYAVISCHSFAGTFEKWPSRWTRRVGCGKIQKNFSYWQRIRNYTVSAMADLPSLSLFPSLRKPIRIFRISTKRQRLRLVVISRTFFLCIPSFAFVSGRQKTNWSNDREKRIENELNKHSQSNNQTINQSGPSSGVSRFKIQNRLGVCRVCEKKTRKACAHILFKWSSSQSCIFSIHNSDIKAILCGTSRGDIQEQDFRSRSDQP